MEKCWKKMQVPRKFTILMMMMMILFAVVGVVAGLVLIYFGSTVMFGVPLLMIGLAFFALFITWIIFIDHQIYAPVGSSKNYGERKPINTRFRVYTYATWLYVFAMSLYGLMAVGAAIASLVFFVLGFDDKFELVAVAVVLLIIDGPILGLWIWFIVYQTKPMYQNKQRNPNKR